MPARTSSKASISKRRDAPYRSGRDDTWIKSKVGQNQEFVVVGYKEAAHLKGAVGALVLGYHEDGKLRYAGRSGSGYDTETARDLWKKLAAAAARQAGVRKASRGGTRAQGHLGRAEARCRDRVQRRLDRARARAPRGVQGAARGQVRRGRRAGDADADQSKVRIDQVESQAKTTPRKAEATNGGAVKLTHPDRIYWSDVEITKQQLADYYTAVWDHIAPHLVRRPLALLRCPEGVDGQCFFQKHAAAGLISERIGRHKDGHGEELIYIDDLDGLLTLAQAGVLEIHVWGSTIDDVEHCNRLVFDLDPGDDVKWADVNATARELRERLADIKLKSFVKTTGGKGLHVVVPIDATPWDDAKDFSHAMVLAMAADAPERYVAKMTKSIRKGKIFLDYLRNGRGATAIVAFSTRARPGATVSTPVAWDELGPKLAPNKFTVLNIGKRLAQLKSDPWAGIDKVRQKLPDFARK